MPLQLAPFGHGALVGSHVLPGSSRLQLFPPNLLGPEPPADLKPLITMGADSDSSPLPEGLSKRAFIPEYANLPTLPVREVPWLFAVTQLPGNDDSAQKVA